jgi:hypothetical protein
MSVMVSLPFLAVRREGQLEGVQQGGENARAGAAEGVAEGDGAAVDVHLLLLELEAADDGEGLGGEGLVQLHEVEVVHAEAEARQQLLRRGHRADAHGARVHARRRAAEDGRAHGQTLLLRVGARGDHERSGAVVEGGAIARRDRAAVLLEGGAQLRELLDAGVAPRPFVLADDEGVALALGDGDGHELRVEVARVLGGGGLLMGGEGEGVLVLARDGVLRHEVLRRLTHLLEGEELPHLGVREAPAEGGVEDRRVADGESHVGLLHGEGRAAHALDAAGEADVAVPHADGARGLHHSFEPRGAEAVEGHGRHGLRQPGEQHAHARDVAVVLARLVRAAGVGLVDGVVRHAGAADGLAEDVGEQVVGAHGRQPAADAADGRAAGADDDGIPGRGLEALHGRPPRSSLPRRNAGHKRLGAPPAAGRSRAGAAISPDIWCLRGAIAPEEVWHVNPWLQRALISAGAAVVSTTAIVTTADRPGKRSKKKRKKKRGKSERKEGTDGVRVEGDEHVPRSPGAQAAYDYRVGPESGMTGAELLENLKSAGSKTAKGITTLGGWLTKSGAPPPPEGEGEPGAPRKKKKRRRRRRRRVKKGEAPQRSGARKKKRKRAAADEADELDELKKAAAKKAAEAAAKSAADKAGVGGAFDAVKESSEEIAKKAGELGASIREKVPEDLGEKVGESLSSAGRSIRDGATKIGDKVKTALDEDGDGEPDIGAKLNRGWRGFTRWIEGPGSQSYEEELDPDKHAPEPSRVRAAPDDDAVDAKDESDEEAPEVVEARVDKDES